MEVSDILGLRSRPGVPIFDSAHGLLCTNCEAMLISGSIVASSETICNLRNEVRSDASNCTIAEDAPGNRYQRRVGVLLLSQSKSFSGYWCPAI